MQYVSDNVAKAGAALASVAFTFGIFALTNVVMPVSEYAASTGAIA